MDAYEQESARERREKNIAKSVITFLCIVAMVIIAYIDAQAKDFDAPKELYFVLAAIAIGVGPKDAIQYLAEKAKK